MQSAKQKERELIIGLHKKKKTVREIGYILGISKSKAAFWINRFDKTKSLENKSRSGRPSRLNAEQIFRLKKDLLSSPPKRYGGESFGWTTKLAINYVKENFGVTYGMRQIQKLFHKAGLSLITPRSQHNKSSYAARTVYKEEFKKNSKKNIWVAQSLISTKQDSD